MVAQLQVEPERGIEARHRAGAGIVGVVRPPETIVGAEAEVVEAKGADHAKAGAQRQVDLAEQRGRPHPLLLIERQRGPLAAIVREVAAIVALEFALNAEVRACRSGRHQPVPCQGEPYPAAVAVQVDHAGGDRIVQFAPHAVGGKRPLHSPHGPLPADAGLALPHVLGRAPPHVEAPCLIAALIEEFAGQRPGVQRVQLQAVELHRQASTGGLGRESRVQRRARGLAVRILAGVRLVGAEAIETAPSGTGPEGDAPGRPGSCGLQAQGPVRPGHNGCLLAIGAPVGSRAFEEDDAAGPVSVERGCRTAQRLHPAQRADVQVVEGALAVGQGRGDPVDEDLYAADAELRACPEAPNGDPLADRRVVAILHPHAREAVQRLLDEQARVAPCKIGARDHGRGKGHAVQPHRGPQHRDHDGRKRDGVFGLGLPVDRSRAEWRHADQRRGGHEHHGGAQPPPRGTRRGGADGNAVANGRAAAVASPAGCSAQRIFPVLDEGGQPGRAANRVAFPAHRSCRHRQATETRGPAQPGDRSRLPARRRRADPHEATAVRRRCLRDLSVLAVPPTLPLFVGLHPDRCREPALRGRVLPGRNPSWTLPTVAVAGGG